MMQVLSNAGTIRHEEIVLPVPDGRSVKPRVTTLRE